MPRRPGRILGGETGRGAIESVALVAARVAASLLTLGWTLALTRTVPPAVAGQALALVAMAELASVVLSMNVESGAIRHLVRYRSAGEDARAAGFAAFPARVVLCLLVPVAAVLWMVSGGGDVWALAAVLTAAPLIALARIAGRQATALGAVRAGLLPRMVLPPACVLATLLAAGAAGKPVTPGLVLWSFAGAFALAVGLQRWLLRDRLRFAATRPRDLGPWRGWLRDGVLLSPALAIQEYGKSTAVAAAALVLAEPLVARFGVLFSTLGIVIFGVVAVETAFSARISRALVEGRAADRDRLIAASGAIKLAGIALAAPLVAGLGGAVLGLFGPAYAGDAALLLLLLAIPLLRAAFGPAALILTVLGAPGAVAAGHLVGLCGLVGGIALGAAAAGVAGAALGAVAGTALHAGGLWVLCRRRTGIDALGLAAALHLRGPAPAGLRP